MAYTEITTEFETVEVLETEIEYVKKRLQYLQAKKELFEFLLEYEIDQAKIQEIIHIDYCRYSYTLNFYFGIDDPKNQRFWAEGIDRYKQLCQNLLDLDNEEFPPYVPSEEEEIAEAKRYECQKNESDFAF